jgi:hypothetical protein
MTEYDYIRSVLEKNDRKDVLNFFNSFLKMDEKWYNPHNLREMGFENLGVEITPSGNSNGIVEKTKWVLKTSKFKFSFEERTKIYLYNETKLILEFNF